MNALHIKLQRIQHNSSLQVNCLIQSFIIFYELHRNADGYFKSPISFQIGSNIKPSLMARVGYVTPVAHPDLYNETKFKNNTFNPLTHPYFD